MIKDSKIKELSEEELKSISSGTSDGSECPYIRFEEQCRANPKCKWRYYPTGGGDCFPNW